jgi:putative redox protein
LAPPTRKSYRVDIPGGLGFKLAGIVDRPDDDAPHPVLLFSHCFTCNKDLKAIVRIARYLAEKGVIVLRYDMTGLGGSEGRFADTNFDSNVADLLAAAAFADRNLGAPTVLLGHSLGGAASLAAASRWPTSLKPLRGVAALAAPSDTKHLATLLVAMDHRVETEGRGTVTIGGRHWETTPQLIDNLRRFDLPENISRLTLPLLLFHSPVDATVGIEHAIRIMGLASNATTSLVALPGADHLLVNNNADIQYVGEVTAAWIHRLESDR